MTTPSLFPKSLPRLTPTTLRDISTAGERYQGEGVSDEQLASFRSEVARFRRGYRLSTCSPSQSTVSSRAERSAALRSTLLEWRSNIDVTCPPEGVGVVGRDVTVGAEPLLPPAVLARCDLTPRTALGLLPLRPWASCVQKTSCQLPWQVCVTPGLQVE